MELARRIGRPHSFIVRIERGDNTYPPDPYDFGRISRELDLPQARMLQALGYLDQIPEDAIRTGDTVTFPADDPRLELMRLLDGATRSQIRDASRVMEVVMEVLRSRTTS